MKERLSTVADLFRELRRRKVIHVAAVYLGGAIVGLDAVNNAMDTYNLPTGLQRAFGVLVVVGFPVAVLTSWWYDWTEEGIRKVDVRTPSKAVSRLAAAMAVTLVVAAGALSMVVILRGPPGGSGTRTVMADEQSLVPAGFEPVSSNTVLGILPVQFASANDDLAWIADALAGYLEEALAEIPAFTVIYRRSLEAFGYTGSRPDSAHRLPQVDYLVSAEVIDAPGGGITVLLKLVNGKTAEVVGNDRITVMSASPETIETLVLRAEEVLRPALGEQHRLREWQAGTSDTVAFRLRYQAEEVFSTARDLARYDWQAASRGFEAADSILDTVNARDPDWVDPYVARARVAGQWALIPGGGETRSPAEIFDRGIQHANAALQRDADNADALSLRGRLRWRKTRIAPETNGGEAARLTDLAEADLRAAIKLDPHQVMAAATLSEILYWARARYAEARRFAEQAYRQDAYLEQANEIINRIALSAFQVGDDQDALGWSRIGLLRFPDAPMHQAAILEIMAWGNVEPSVEEAWRFFESITDAAPGTEKYYCFTVAAILARAGLADSARAVLRREIESLTPAERAIRLDLEAGVRFRLGDTARARALFQEMQKQDQVEARSAASRRVLRDFVEVPG